MWLEQTTAIDRQNSVLESLTEHIKGTYKKPVDDYWNKGKIVSWGVDPVQHIPVITIIVWNDKLWNIFEPEQWEK